MEKQNEDKRKLEQVRKAMIQRCTNPNNHEYHNYGGRGITICEEWTTSKDAFINWALANGYRQGLSIDRINNDGNYCPENCRWATPKEQSRNMRKNLYITLCGETHLYSDWPKILGLSKSGFRKRLESGWSEERIVNEAPGSTRTSYHIPVNQYTLDGKFVRRWNSAYEARQFGYNDTNIRRCCSGQRPTHKGYIWKDAV